MHVQNNVFEPSLRQFVSEPSTIFQDNEVKILMLEIYIYLFEIILDEIVIIFVGVRVEKAA